MPTPGAVGVWNGTGVRLFGVREGEKVGPSLSRPRGAVDVVGRRLVQGVQGLGLSVPGLGSRGGGGGGGRGGNAQTVREV